MKKISLIALCLLLAGCSVFKKSTKEQTKQTEQTEVRDILTNTDEEIEITIPPNLFARIYGKDIRVAEGSKDTVRKEESVRDSRTANYSEQAEVSGPVKIKINRKTQTQDNSTIETEQQESSKEEQVTEKESKDFIGNFKWFVFISGIAVIAVSIFIIRFCL